VGVRQVIEAVVALLGRDPPGADAGDREDESVSARWKLLLGLVALRTRWIVSL